MSVELLLMATPTGATDEALLRVRQAAAWLRPVRLEVACLGPAVVALAYRQGPSTRVGELSPAPPAPTTAGTPAVEHALVAVSSQAAAAARAHPRPEELGAEGGHVRVTTRADGVTILTDGIGRIPVYWAEDRGALLVSTALGALVSLGLPFAWDDVGVTEYLATLYPLGTRTVIRRAAVLPAGAALWWRRGERAAVESHPLFAPSEHELSDDEVVAEFRSRWTETLQDMWARHEGRRVALGLSGGLDSRVIAAGLASHGRRPLTFTYGDSRNREVRVARQIAERLGLPHATLPVTSAEMLRDWRTCTLALDGAHSPAEMYESWFQHWLSSAMDVLVSGIWGGPLWGDDKALGLAPRDLPEALRDRLVTRLESARLLLRPDVFGTAGDWFRGEVANSLEGWTQQRTDIAVFWKVDNPQRRWGLMLPIIGDRLGLAVEAPFLDARILTLTAALTPRQRRYGALYLRIHRDVVDALADIPRTKDGNAPARLTHVYWAGDESLAAQLSALGRAHPVSAARRALLEARHRGSTALLRKRRNPLADRVLAADDVFDPTLLLQNSGYRQRLADLIDAGLPDVPGVLDGDALEVAAHRLRIGDVAGLPSPLALARAATLGVWGADWAGRSMTASPTGEPSQARDAGDEAR